MEYRTLFYGTGLRYNKNACLYFIVNTKGSNPSLSAIKSSETTTTIDSQKLTRRNK